MTGPYDRASSGDLHKCKRLPLTPSRLGMFKLRTTVRAASNSVQQASALPLAFVTASRTFCEASPVNIFDRELKTAHRDRAAQLSGQEDSLQGAVADNLLDRLDDCVARFRTVAILGGAGFEILKRLTNGRGGIENVVLMDQSGGQIRRAQRLQQEMQGIQDSWPQVQFLQGDPEFLPLKEKHFDAIISCLDFHWINELPEAMAQCRRALRPDGLFLAVMWGGDTLHELRVSLSLAEQEVAGGLSQRVSPLAQVRDAGNLLTRAGLSIPSVDLDDITVHYTRPMALVQHLRAMGESNAARQREPRLSRKVWEAADQKYRDMFGSPDGVPATFQAIYMTGWAPSPKQPRAAARGSATVSFQDLEKAMQDKNTLPEGVSEASGGPDDRGEAPPRGQATLEADDGASPADRQRLRGLQQQPVTETPEHEESGRGKPRQ